MFKKLARNPYILFSPFLLFYAYFIKINKWPKLYGDEIRYVDFAHNLIHGYYSPSAPHIDLWNGPGYPFILLPFIALHVPVLYITLLNALYLYLAIVFLYKALTLTATRKIALVCCLLLGIYPNALAILPILYTEAFTGFLVSAFVYAVALCFDRGSLKYGIIAGVVLGYLILTKIIFGYVIVIGLLICLIILILKKNKSFYVKQVYILSVAFAVSVPYLAYTYYVTGKVFYWGNSGGMSLYWMSTPYPNEYGDWKVPDLSNHQYPSLYKSTEAIAILKKNHSREMKFILAHNELEQDELFKQIALKNIRKAPLKFIGNYINNISRMLFNFPYSYAWQDAAIVRNIITGSIILWASIAGIIMTFLNWRRVIAPVKLVLLITAVYLLLSGALSAYPRQLDVVMPVFLFWFGYLAANIKKPDFRFLDDSSVYATGEIEFKLKDISE